MHIDINENLVKDLISTQFPKWKDLPIHQILPGGWDNRSFRLGTDMLIRLPSSKPYCEQVQKEHKWLPRLAPLLPFQIPEPLKMGKPNKEYPWNWSIYSYLKGEDAASATINDMCSFATSLSRFLKSLHSLDTKGGPLPGAHNFYRGGALKTYDKETRETIALLKDKIDANLATEIWDTGLQTLWRLSPVWIHGDISAGNLLVENGNLTSIIDFGMLGIGDPACDLSICWTFFKGRSREIFRTELPYDSATWARARAWTLWKALTVAAKADISSKKRLFSMIEAIFRDYLDSKN